MVTKRRHCLGQRFSWDTVLVFTLILVHSKICHTVFLFYFLFFPDPAPPPLPPRRLKKPWPTSLPLPPLPSFQPPTGPLSVPPPVPPRGKFCSPFLPPVFKSSCISKKYFFKFLSLVFFISWQAEKGQRVQSQCQHCLPQYWKTSWHETRSEDKLKLPQLFYHMLFYFPNYVSYFLTSHSYGELSEPSDLWEM